MNQTTKIRSVASGLVASAVAAVSLLLAPTAQAAVTGITGPTFALTASDGYNSQPDGQLIYSWGYGCTKLPAGFLPAAPAGSQGPAPTCPLMQMPGPTMIVTEGDTVSVTLTNGLPVAAGNTSIVFPGFNVTSTGGAAGLMAQEAANGSTRNTVTYSFKATKPGTYSYYSGSQADLQIEMGLYGAIIVKPSAAQTVCKHTGPSSLAANAYDNPNTCYDREYLFQFAEMSGTVHQQVKDQVDACPTGPRCPPLVTTMEPYHPNYFLINGRSMPDIMDTPYAAAYANQPYNGNPHMHPGELVLMRTIGQGRWQHPFHFHGNHARLLARDANLLVSTTDGKSLAGPLLFTMPTVSGQSTDMIFTWTGKGLNWDVYNHSHKGTPAGPTAAGNVTGDTDVCYPDANGYYTAQSSPPAPANALNYGEWCADHNKAIPVTPPDPTIVQIGQWYGGTPYLGLQSASTGFTSTTKPPGTLDQNPQAGYAYMWHSHNEREITTNDVFPGGMMMMLIIDPPAWTIDETQ